MTTPSTSHLPDDPLQAAVIVTFALDITLLACEEIQRFATDRLDHAPGAALYACDLAASMAGSAIEWVQQRPPSAHIFGRGRASRPPTPAALAPTRNGVTK